VGTNVKDIEHLNSADLRNYYLDVVGQPPPPKTSRYFIKGQIAWALQAQQLGEDPMELRQSLMQRVITINESKKPHYKPGTRLVREWQGHVYEVTVLELGYEYKGADYRSLSQIANVITGAHCSGPRFFGVNKNNK
jgi:hypothetical protein